MEIRELETGDEREEAVPILRQLWTDETAAEVREWTGEDEYHLFGGYVDGDLVAVAGVTVAGVLHHARHAWLYDLVVDEPRRGEGFGAELVAHVEEWARERGCEYVALATPLDKEERHDFYEAIDFEQWGYVIEKEI